MVRMRFSMQRYGILFTMYYFWFIKFLKLLLNVKRKLAERVAPSGVVLPEEVDGGEYLVGWHDGCGKVAVTVGFEVPSHPMEIKVGLQDCAAGCPMAAYKEVHRGCRVQIGRASCRERVLPTV